MRKRGLILFFMTGIFLIGLVSAASFSFSNFLDSIDSSLIILGTILVVCFALIYFALSKFFKGNNTIASVIAFAVSLLITWSINKTGIDFEGLFLNIGIPTDVLYIILPFVVLAGLIFLTVKVGFGWMLMVVGGSFIGVSFTELVYEKEMLFIIGAVALVVGFLLLLRKRKKGKIFGGGRKSSSLTPNYDDYSYPDSKGPSKRELRKEKRKRKREDKKEERSAYEQELEDRRHEDEMHKANIRARAKHGAGLRKEKEKRGKKRKKRRDKYQKQKNKRKKGKKEIGRDYTSQQTIPPSRQLSAPESKKSRKERKRAEKREEQIRELYEQYGRVRQTGDLTQLKQIARRLKKLGYTEIDRQFKADVKAMKKTRKGRTKEARKAKGEERKHNVKRKSRHAAWTTRKAYRDVKKGVQKGVETRKQKKQSKKEEKKQKRELAKQKGRQIQTSQSRALVPTGKKSEQQRKQQKKFESKLMKDWKKDKAGFLRVLQSGDENQKKKMYRTLLKKYHPDVNNNDPVATQITVEIGQMYNR